MVAYANVDGCRVLGVFGVLVRSGRWLNVIPYACMAGLSPRAGPYFEIEQLYDDMCQWYFYCCVPFRRVVVWMRARCVFRWDFGGSFEYIVDLWFHVRGRFEFSAVLLSIVDSGRIICDVLRIPVGFSSMP